MSRRKICGELRYSVSLLLQAQWMDGVESIKVSNIIRSTNCQAISFENYSTFVAIDNISKTGNDLLFSQVARIKFWNNKVAKYGLKWSQTEILKDLWALCNEKIGYRRCTKATRAQISSICKVKITIFIRWARTAVYKQIPHYYLSSNSASLCQISIPNF